MEIEEGMEEEDDEEGEEGGSTLCPHH